MKAADDLIRKVFLANGFTVKEGQTDLKPYVFEAGRALIAAWCAQAEVAGYEVKMGGRGEETGWLWCGYPAPIGGLITASRVLYTHPAPPQSCTEAEYIGRIVALECELQAVKAERRTVPDGWKLVPLDPTPAMLEAGKTITEYCHTANGWMPMRTSTYQIMVAAAPEAPK